MATNWSSRRVPLWWRWRKPSREQSSALSLPMMYRQGKSPGKSGNGGGHGRADRLRSRDSRLDRSREQGDLLMCGIVAYIGDELAGPILFDTLKRLEYRGYDSAGIAVKSGGEIEVLKSAGRIADLEKVYKSLGSPGECMGIGHTRWATHGRPSDLNAHPHTSGEIAIVHNGIIENYLDLRELLTEMGYEFQSETDSEVLAHLIHFYYRGDLYLAVCTGPGEGGRLLCRGSAGSQLALSGLCPKREPSGAGQGGRRGLCGIRCSCASSLHRRCDAHEGWTRWLAFMRIG